jgi:hypothetical protein
MKVQKTFCEQIAAKYAQRAEETTDREVRKFFYRMRDNWLKVEGGIEGAGGPAPTASDVMRRAPIASRNRVGMAQMSAPLRQER